MKHKQFEAIFNISSLYYYLKAHEFFTRTVTDQDVFSEFCSVLLFFVCVWCFFLIAVKQMKSLSKSCEIMKFN